MEWTTGGLERAREREINVGLVRREINRLYCLMLVGSKTGKKKKKRSMPAMLLPAERGIDTDATRLRWEFDGRMVQENRKQQQHIYRTAHRSHESRITTAESIM